MLKSFGYSIEAFNWIPLTSFSYVLFVANIAVLTLPLVVISEILPTNVKDFGLSICMTVLWTFAFIVTKFLPFWNQVLGFHGDMFLFASICLAGELFIFLFVPETKGKSHKQIVETMQ